MLVGELARRGGKQEKGKNEDSRRGGHHDLRVHARLLRGHEGDEDHQGVLEQVVVERAEKLGDEQRQEAPGLEQVKLVLVHRVSAEGNH